MGAYANGHAAPGVYRLGEEKAAAARFRRHRLSAVMGAGKLHGGGAAEPRKILLA